MPVPREERKLDSLVGELIAPLLSAKPRPGGWTLASWDVEQGICITIRNGTRWLLIELEPLDETHACYARTRYFNVHPRPRFGPPRDLSSDEVRVVDQIIAMLRRREPMLPLAPLHEPRPSLTRTSAVREITVERLLVAESPGQYYLNPYSGCMIGCKYCYVAHRADISRALEGLPRLEWGRYVDVKVNAAEVLRREIATLPPGTVRLSPIVTDPYQPIERRYRITRQCLEVLVDTAFSPVILTRAGRIVEDLDLIRRFPKAAVGISIPTDDDEIRKHFEPGGDPIDERLAALRAFHEAGVQTVAVIQPLLPMNPERLAELIAPLASVIRIDRMYEIDRVRHLYEAAGRLDATTDAFFEETGAALREALERRGVTLDPLDNLVSLLG